MPIRPAGLSYRQVCYGMRGFLQQREHVNIYNLVVNRMELEKCPKNRIVTQQNVPKIATETFRDFKTI